MSIEERLAQLEKGTRFWKRLAFVLLAALGAVVLLGQGREGGGRDLFVRSLTIVDDQGLTKAELMVSRQNGLPYLYLHDERGKAREGELRLPSVSLSSFGLSCTSGEERTTQIASFGCFGKDKQAGFDLRLGLRARARVRLESDGSPSMALFDRDGQARAVLGVTETEDRLTGPKAMTSERAKLTIYDAAGELIWQAPR